jgi:peptidoglycan/xylan/chitin deacetylase (PgdA/CDA1 family)
MWTLDTLDWRKPAPEEITARIVPHIENGVLILMHPTEPTLKALPSIIEGALNKGIELGTLSEVLSSDRIIFIEPVN